MKIKIYSSQMGERILDVPSTTWGQLQQQLSNNGISYSNMKAVVGETKVTLEADAATLPTTDFTLFLMPKKTKAGSDIEDRVNSLPYAQVRRDIKDIMSESQENKDFFNKDQNYTRKSSAKLRKLLTEYLTLNESAEEAPVKEVVEEVREETKSEGTVADVVETVKEAKEEVVETKEEVKPEEATCEAEKSTKETTKKAKKKDNKEIVETVSKDALVFNKKNYKGKTVSKMKKEMSALSKYIKSSKSVSKKFKKSPWAMSTKDLKSLETYRSKFSKFISKAEKSTKAVETESMENQYRNLRGSFNDVRG